MRLSRIPGRALLLGTLGLTACDVAQVVLDPTFPGVVQTWSFPATTQAIDVAELLPAGVDTNAAGTAFVVAINGINTNRRLGAYCALCQALNGTTAAKPAFIISPDTGSTTNLPTNVDSATVISGTMSYTITNGLSFDPLRVNPSNLANPQGKIYVTVRSGSLVLARDSILGTATTMAAGTAITRNLPPCSTVPATTPCFATGKVGGAITVDLLVDSPLGEPAFINANGLLVAQASVSNLEVASAVIRVPATPMNSGAPQEMPEDVVPEDLRDRVVGGRLEMTVTNPFAVSGNVSVIFNYGSGSYNKPFDTPLTTVITPQERFVSFTGPELQNILQGTPTTFAVDGTLSSTVPITVTPQQSMAISNRLVLSIRVGGE